jgi:DNA polymerase-1
MIRNYYDEFTELEPWKEHVLQEARDLGDRADPTRYPPYVAIPPFGRRRRLPDLFHPEFGVARGAERQAVNARVQGFAANITKLAMRELHLQLPNFNAQMLAQVHDEIVIRAPKDAADDVLKLTEQLMSGVEDPIRGGPILRKVPLVVSVASGDNWAKAKGK